MQKPPDWISVPVAAELLGCTDVWVIKMISRGDLEGFKLSGRAWAVKRTSVEANVRKYLSRDPSLSGRKRSKLG
jgi:excisionase family DNA binding protein